MYKKELFHAALSMRYIDGSPTKYLQPDGKTWGPYATSLAADKNFMTDREKYLNAQKAKYEDLEKKIRTSFRTLQTGNGNVREYLHSDGTYSRTTDGSLYAKYTDELKNLKEEMGYLD